MLEFTIHFCHLLYTNSAIPTVNEPAWSRTICSSVFLSNSRAMIGKQQNERIQKPPGHKPTTGTMIEYDTLYAYQLVHRLNHERPRSHLSPKTILSLPLSLKYWWDALEQEERIAPTTPTISESAASCWAAILQLVEGFVPPSLIMPAKDWTWSS